MERRILFVTQTAFHPPYQGDSARVAALVSYFRQRGWFVAVCHFHDPAQLAADYGGMASRCDVLSIYRPSERDLADRHLGGLDSWCPPGLLRQVGEDCRRLQVMAVVAQCAFLSRCLCAADAGTVRVLDADNLFAGRQDVYQRVGLEYDWFSCTREEEALALSRADLILAIQESELQALRGQAGGRPVLLVPHARTVLRAAPGDPASLLFVGADNPENRAGVGRFLDAAWPEIRREHPNARFTLLGGVARHVSGPVPGVKALGVVDDLTPYYHQAGIALSLAPCGTGLKIKTVEALCYGKCLVTTPAGIQGLERYPEVYHLAPSAAECGPVVARLLRDPERVRSTGEAAHRFASWYFRPDTVYGRLEEAIRNWPGAVCRETSAHAD